MWTTFYEKNVDISPVVNTLWITYFKHIIKYLKYIYLIKISTRLDSFQGIKDYTFTKVKIDTKILAIIIDRFIVVW